jgi:hypothetical protein
MLVNGVDRILLRVQEKGDACRVSRIEGNVIGLVGFDPSHAQRPRNSLFLFPIFAGSQQSQPSDYLISSSSRASSLAAKLLTFTAGTGRGFTGVTSVVQ